MPENTPKASGIQGAADLERSSGDGQGADPKGAGGEQTGQPDKSSSGRGAETAKSSSQNDFSKGSVAGNIMRMAVPMTLAQLLNVLYNIVDRIYIGRIPGASTMALTGVGVCFPLITLISAFSDLFGTGGAPLCSIARGKKENRRAGEIMGTAFFMLVVTALILTVILQIFQRPILFAFGASGETYPYAAAYMRIYSAGTIFMMISLGMNPFINSQGFGKIGMMTVAIGAVLNIVLDPILIFGLGMGVEGAALATIISQAVSALWVLRFLTGKKAILRLNRETIRFRAKMAGQICSLGLTGFIVNFTNSAVQLACNKMLSLFGGDLYIGIMTVLNSVRTVTSLPVQGVSNAAQPVMGYNYGAGERERVRQCIRFLTVVCIVYTAGIWLCVVIFPSLWIHLFNSDPALLEQGVPALQLYFFGFVMMAFQFAGQASFTALGKARQAVFFSLFRKIVIVVPLTIALPYVGGLGVNGVFLAEPVSNFVGGLACFATMYVTVYRRLGRPEARDGITKEPGAQSEDRKTG